MSNYVVYSDASATWGVVLTWILMVSKFVISNGILEERRRSSTWRELSLILFALHSFFTLIVGSYVKWISDSRSACKIVQVEYKRNDLHAIALENFQLCANNGIELEVQWIPRTEIERADYISRIIDIDDWQISANCFMFFRGKLGGFIQGVVLLFIICIFLGQFPL